MVVSFAPWKGKKEMGNNNPPKRGYIAGLHLAETAVSEQTNTAAKENHIDGLGCIFLWNTKGVKRDRQTHRVSDKRK